MRKRHPMGRDFAFKKVITLDDLIEHFELRKIESENPYNDYWKAILRYDVAALDILKQIKAMGVNLCESKSEKAK